MAAGDHDDANEEVQGVQGGDRDTRAARPWAKERRARLWVRCTISCPNTYATRPSSARWSASSSRSGAENRTIGRATMELTRAYSRKRTGATAQRIILYA